MMIHSVFDAAFAPYGKVLGGYDTAALTDTLKAVAPVPEGVDYVPCSAAPGAGFQEIKVCCKDCVWQSLLTLSR